MGHMYVRCTSPTLLPLCVCVCAPREEVSRGEGQRMDALSQVAEQLGRPTEEVCLHLLVSVGVWVGVDVGVGVWVWVWVCGCVGGWVWCGCGVWVWVCGCVGGCGCGCMCVGVWVCVHVGRFPPQVYEGHTFLLEQYHKAFLQQQVKSPDVSLSVVAFHDLLRCKYIVVVICCHFQ